MGLCSFRLQERSSILGVGNGSYAQWFFRIPFERYLAMTYLYG